ncbi:DNA topoisomerase 3-alpha [Ceratina calcarata]|uniref:DNA topoisomerase n=1 Tax=Ceratina calcarata TaxID=156304 RepID=A0AAJ7J5V6_9HYME|nr:DNA topoisomerase 3-alpha [Ceratina calcarata]
MLRVIKVFNVVKLNLCKFKQHRYLIVRFKSSVQKMKVLNVAEKNDAAKTIAGFLSRGSSKRRDGLSPYNKIYEFSVQLWNKNCDMIMTSVSGHLLNYAFVGSYCKWQSCHPLALFDAPVIKQCPDENGVKIKRTLEREVKQCQALIIWTDCDREGENIGFEVIQVCQAVKQNILIYRAKFSEITSISVNRALQNLCQPDKAISDAVDVRSELDLRIGAAFTRFQTLRLQQVFPQSLADMLISYGSCQFPTLGFVVERFLAIERFKPEPYWKLRVTDNRDNISVEFRWARVRLFEKLPCEVLLDTCLERPNATVTKITVKPKNKWRPLPLDTVELEKQCSRKLRMSAKQAMKIAEKLYTQGLISYPRTETNIFPKELNLTPLVNEQVNDSSWGNFAQRLLQNGLTPRQGKKSDQAHPPIHPIKYSNTLHGDEAEVYNYVVRHFLACLSSNAVGQETVVEIDIAGEKFIANGLRIIEKNYLEVYIYEKWSDKEIATYREGEVFRPAGIDMVEEETSPPQLLTEADLISLMDKYGIGTDATHADHIDTIKSRQYVGLMDGKHLMPGKLGIGLVMGYDNMGFQMSKPDLRADLEKGLKLICERQKDPKDVLKDQIDKYREVFKISLERANLIDQALAEYLGEHPSGSEGPAFNDLPEKTTIFKCPKCGSDMVLRTRKQGTGKFISCMGFPTCNNAIWFPENIESVDVLDEVCPHCPGNIRKLKFKLTRNLYTMFGADYTTCIGGCDPAFNEALSVKKDNIISQGRNVTDYSSLSNESVISNSRSNGTRGFSTQNHASIGLVSGSQNQNRHNNTNRSTNTRPRNNLKSRTSAEDISVPDDSRSNQDPRWSSNDAAVMCNCHEAANQFTVRKEGPNQGRRFYTCSKPRGTGCDFFLWADDSQNAQSNTTRDLNRTAAPSFNAGPSSIAGPSYNDASSSLTGEIKCRCNIAAVRRVVRKDGPNQGRPFYGCSKSIEESCKFFQWDDENAENTFNNSFSNQNKRKRGENRSKNPQTKSRTARKCGICKMEGHTRKNCPQNAMD